MTSIEPTGPQGGSVEHTLGASEYQAAKHGPGMKTGSQAARLTTDQLNQIAVYVRDFLIDSARSSDQDWVESFPRAAEHRWQHTLNVVKNAEGILAGEGAVEPEVSIVRAAALLHDVSMFVCDHSVHGQVSADMATEYLKEHGLAPDLINRIHRAIAEHGTSLGDLLPEEQGAQFSWEGRVLLEADILDKLGASAIANGLMYLGEQGKLNFEARRELIQGPTYQRAEFFKDYLWTGTGKRMAGNRFARFERFLESLAEEIVDLELPAWDPDH